MGGSEGGLRIAVWRGRRRKAKCNQRLLCGSGRRGRAAYPWQKPNLTLQVERALCEETLRRSATDEKINKRHFVRVGNVCVVARMEWKTLSGGGVVRSVGGIEVIVWGN